MTNSNAKGDRVERELVNKLDSAGWEVMRAPASGSATERELPDVLCGNGQYFYVLELKASQRDEYIYLTDEEVTALKKFADGFGGFPRVGARYDYNAWRFFNPNALYRTDGGNYRVGEEDLDDGQTIDELADGPL